MVAMNNTVKLRIDRTRTGRALQPGGPLIQREHSLVQSIAVGVVRLELTPRFLLSRDGGVRTHETSRSRSERSPWLSYIPVQYPRGGFSIPNFLHHFPTATSDIPNC